MSRALTLQERARAWVAIDPDPATRAEVEALLERGDDGVAGLQDRFDARLTFGTAGLRGAIGAGPNRMNRVVVAQTSAGLARFLRQRAATPSAVVGYDARHGSATFARDTAGVLAAAGVAVTLLPAALPTPVLAFAVRDLGVSAGIMITASHNPAADNGYKLYLGDADAGSQLVAPADAAVLAEIDAVVAEGVLPAMSDAFAIADDGVLDRYVTATAAVGAAAGNAPDAPAVALHWVYTPMHGVGLATMQRVLSAAGLPTPIVVPAQAEPDADFPTVAFPNPEEPGALDLALRAAANAGADLVLANDPDADRLAVAVPDPRALGGWRPLSGNEVGLILAWGAASGARHDPGRGVKGTFATSIVSTPGLAAVARHFGFDTAETLTGFKWISRVPGLRYGFEEALGYLVNPGDIRDKDGISAAVAMLREVLALAASGRTLLDRLDEIALTVGRFASDQVSVRVTEQRDTRRIMTALRDAPPASIGGLPVQGVDDLLLGGALPPTDGLRFRLGSDARVIIRPSGTEPKIKAYLDVLVATGTLPERLDVAATRLAALRADVQALLT